MLSTIRGQDYDLEESDLDGISPSSSSLHAELLNRAQLLLAELTTFQSYLQSQKKEDAVDIRQFRSSVQSESKSLDRIISALPNGDRTLPDNTDRETRRLHVLRSSNLPFYEAVWAAAGTRVGVIALGKRFHRDDTPSGYHSKPRSEATLGNKTRESKDKRDSITADIVANDGQAWIKVSTITEKRLIFEMAKEGWEGYDDDSSDADSDFAAGTLSGPSQGERLGLELVRLAKNMKMVASTVRVRYRHPKIHLILPKISEGRLPEIDAVIEEIRKTGAEVQLQSSSKCSADSALYSRFSRMLPRVHPSLSSTLNIDCTILLALISDISHLRPENLPAAPSGKYHTAIIRQIRSEETSILLHSELYPILVGREMHSTLHAARRMKEIGQTMGTAAEKARAEILFGQGIYAGLSAIDLVERLQSFSDHDVPANLQLPISVVDVEASGLLVADQSSMMSDVAGRLSEVNQSVFLYGWRQNIVTVSSNMVVAKEIEKRVCQLLDERPGWEDIDLADNLTGPDIWVCRTARSLIGKEKGNRGG